MKISESVLFVDDEANILSAMRRIVMEEEYTSHFANSGAAALAIMEQHSIAVIITDMRMPEMDGLKLLKIVREKYPDTIRIVLSGYTQISQILATVNSADIFRFITKPWNAETDIIGVINAALEYYRLKKENADFQQTLEQRNTAYQKVLKGLEKNLAEQELYLQQVKRISELQSRALAQNQPAMLSISARFLADFMESQSQPDYFDPAALITSLRDAIASETPTASLELGAIETRSSKLAAPWALLRLLVVATLQAVAPELQTTRCQLMLNHQGEAYLLTCRLELSEAIGHSFTLRKDDPRLDFLKLIQSFCQEIFHGRFSFGRDQGNYVVGLDIPAEYVQ